MPITPDKLARRGTRLAARLLDGFIQGAPFVLVLPQFFSLLAVTEQMRASGMSEEEMERQIGVAVASSLMGGFFIALAGCLLILVVQLIFLTKDGQSIGKKALKIRIVEHDTGLNGGFVPNVLIRMWVNTILCIIPFYGLVDVLCIFRADKRCLHDLIAGTSVVKA